MSGKITNIVFYFPKLSETFVLDHLSFLKRIGATVDIISMFDPKIHVPSENVNPETQVHPEAKEFVRSGSVKYCNTSLTETIRHSISMNTKLLHFHFPTLLAFIDDPKVFGGLPVIVNVHTRKDLSNILEMIRGGKRDVVERVNIFITTSETLHCDMLKVGFQTNQVKTVYYGVDTNYFKKRRTFPEIKQRTYSKIITVSRLVPKKGLTYLLRAVDILNHSKFPTHLTVVGEGKEYKKLFSLAEKLEILKYPELRNSQKVIP